MFPPEPPSQPAAETAALSPALEKWPGRCPVALGQGLSASGKQISPNDPWQRLELFVHSAGKPHWEGMNPAASGGLGTKLGEQQKPVQGDVVGTLVCFELSRIMLESIPLWNGGNFSS